MNFDYKYQRFCHEFSWHEILYHLGKTKLKDFALFSDIYGSGEVLMIGENKIFSLKDLNQVSGLGCVCSLSYDLKNQIEKLYSENKDLHGWPDILSFQIETVIRYSNGKLQVAGDVEFFLDKLESLLEITQALPSSKSQVEFEMGMNKENYLDALSSVQKAIQRGDTYELNYCVNSIRKGAIDPIATGLELFGRTLSPFSVMANFSGRWILSGSPERFLKRQGNQLLSQPIKGTAARFKDQEKDELSAQQLHSSSKEISENVMIVDLVRNDLSQLAKSKTVKVEELCALKSYKTVHQLVSSISCVLQNPFNIEDILKATFPMGSMTGAPKIRTMELIEELETFKRSHYSGALGWIAPNGDFDFNVLIRTMFYDEELELASAPAGGAITIESEPEKEWEEVLLKMNAVHQSLVC